MSKSKIKTRKKRLEDYNIKYSDIPKDDPIERIMYCIGDKLTVEKVQRIIDRKNKILNEMSYSSVKLTYYESPAGSNRPRHRNISGKIMSYVPNAKENKKYFEKLICSIKKHMGIIHTPIYITIDTYYRMPSTASVEEKVLFEAKVLNPISLIDVDNIFKAYTDMMQSELLLNDDLIYKAKLESFYSFLPRIELSIYYQDKFASKYIYKVIKSRKSFDKLKDYIKLSAVI